MFAGTAAGAIPLGVYGNHVSFDRLTGQRTQSEAIFIGWDQGRTWGKPYRYFLDSLGDQPHIALKTERARGGAGSAHAASPSVRVRARKMPGVSVDLPPNPYPKMTVVWNPLGIGEPPVTGNGYRDYYPGGAYHDAYGNNYYNTTGSYAWHVTTKLYKAFPSKPFMFPE